MIKIGLSRGKSIIRWFGKLKTGDARYGHIFLIIDDTLIIETTAFGLRVKSLNKYTGTNPKVYKPIMLSAAAKVTIKEEALKQVGTYKGWYGYLKLPLFALDALFRTYWFTQHIGIRHFKVCSQFVAYLFYRYGKYKEWSHWRSMSPDDIDDYCRTSVDFI